MAYYQQQAPYQHHQQHQNVMMMQGGGGYQPHHASPFQQHHQQQQQQQFGHPQQQFGHHPHHHQQHQQHHQYNQQHHHQYGGGGHHYQQQQQHGHGGQFYPPMMETEEDRLEAAQANELLDADSKHENLLGIDYLPCPNTVIVGRGKKVAQHAGNVRFRELVKKELTEYSAATTKAHKSSIILRVLTEIRHKSQYAFVKQNLTTLRWYRVEENAQRITTAQAFRDALKDNYKSSRAHKKLKREEEKKGGADGEKKEKKGSKKKGGKDSNKKDPLDGNGKDSNSPTSSPKPDKAKSRGAARGKALSPIPQEPMQDSPQQPEKPVARKPAAQQTPPPPLTVQSKPQEETKKPDVSMALDGGGDDKDKNSNGSSSGGEKKPQSNQAAVDKMRAMLEAAQSDFTAGNFTWWKPEAVKLASSSDKKMPPPTKKGGRNSVSSRADDDAIPSFSQASCSSLLWSNHSKFSERGSRPRKERDNNFNMSSHSIKTLSNHSIMTISGHSTRSNSTFNGLMAKYGAGATPGEAPGNPFEPRPIAVAVQENEDGAAMDIEMDDVFTSTADMEASTNSHRFRTQPYSAKSSTTFDEGIAMGLGNLSDHSLMSNMSSIHSVKGFTPEEIFVESNHGSKDRSGRHYTSSRYRGGGYPVAMST